MTHSYTQVDHRPGGYESLAIVGIRVLSTDEIHSCCDKEWLGEGECGKTEAWGNWTQEGEHISVDTGPRQNIGAFMVV